MHNRTLKIYRITGNVFNRKTRGCLAGLRVEAWDKDLLVDELASTTTAKRVSSSSLETID